jgi:hypothetical protein
MTLGMAISAIIAVLGFGLYGMMRIWDRYEEKMSRY